MGWSLPDSGAVWSRWTEGAAAAAQNDLLVMGTFGNTPNAARTTDNKKATQHQK
jgi:hypothetical protein